MSVTGLGVFVHVLVHIAWHFLRNRNTHSVQIRNRSYGCETLFYFCIILLLVYYNKKRFQRECVLSVRLIQMFHVESRGWYDIGYNFLVAGDGSAYFGRGWEYQGAHTLGYNKYSMGIAFIGTFNNEPPPKKQLDACKKLIQKGVELGKIAKDYKLFGHRQLASTLSPGDKLFDILKEWPHFVNNFTDIEELLPNY